MTISNNYAPDVSLGNGVTTVFTGSWSPLVASYMRVYLEVVATGVQTLQVLDTDYSLSFTDSGYSITFLLTPPPSTKRVIRAREVALDQTTEYTTAQGFQGATHENSFDKVTAMAQDLKDAVDRSISFPLGSTATATLPEPEAGTLLGWNDAADNLENKSVVDLDGAVIGVNVQAYDATLTAIAALTGLTDNRLLRTDGTAGLYQQSGITVDDSNNVSGVGTVGCGAITSTGVSSLGSGSTGVTPTSTDRTTKLATMEAFNLANGITVQHASTQTGAVATGTTLIVPDDTIPQSNEGDQYMSLAITPKATTNKLRIDVTLVLSNTATQPVLSVALYQDSTADALAVGCKQEATADYLNIFTFSHVMDAGTVSATTFKVRAGGHLSGTTTVNGFSGARKFGGVSASGIRITEYVP